jgi:ParB-like chromosome segregation protein Spo0J
MAQNIAAPRALRNDALPALEIVYVGLDNLRSAARKVRRIDPAHVRQVAATISALRFCVPVIIGKISVVIDGEVRLVAVKHLGLDRAPCVRIDHLSD